MRDSRSRIELFGGVRLLREDSETAKFRTRKTAALLGYLALFSRRSHSREEIAERFWPDQTPEDGRNNLSTALSSLRRLLEPTGVPAGTVLRADRSEIGLNTAAITTDAADFERWLDAERGATTSELKRDALRRATELYRGDLLAGHYEDWVLPEQARFREQWLDALSRHTALAEQAQEWETALDSAGRLLAAEPTWEAAAQAKMRLLGRLGRFSAAQETFRLLEKAIRAELNAAPRQETLDLRACLRQEKTVFTALGSLPAALSAALEPIFTDAPSSGAATPDPPLPEATRNAPSLPLRLTRFFGRESDLARLRGLLQVGAGGPEQAAEKRRLITLTGPGGAGKTRVALELAARLTEDFAGRVWFVPLEGVPDARLFPFALARALKIAVAPRQEPLETVIAALESASALIALDNFEHLLQDEGDAGKPETPDAPFAAHSVRLLLSRLPALTVLVTSRRLLGLEGEQEFPLSPLGVPAPDASLLELQESASAALYADRALSVNPDFAITTRNAAAVGELCRRLEGMPLALEIAAGWVKTLPPAAMLAQTENQMLALASRRRDLPPRQRSLRALIEWSVALLSPELRDAFARCSVFRGGWTLDAALAVCGPDAADCLESLREHSLLVFEDGETPRCHFLAAAREFAAEQISEGAEREAAQSHARYFAGMARWLREEELSKGEVSLPLLAADYENLQSALAWAAQNDLPLGIEMAADLSLFWSHYGYWQTGEQWLETILALCLTEPEASDASRRWRLTRERARFAGWRGDYDLAETLFAASLQWSEANGSAEDVALSLKGLGFTAARRGAMRAAIPHFKAALPRFRALGQSRQIRDTLLWLAHALRETGDHAQAEHCCVEALTLARQASDATSTAIALTDLGNAARRSGARSRAESLLTEALTLCRAIGLKRFKGYCLLGLGDTARWGGDLPRARAFLREGLITLRELHEENSLRIGIADCALLLAQDGHLESAMRLLAAERTLRERWGEELSDVNIKELQTALDAGRDALGADTFERVFQEGGALSLDQAAELALAALTSEN